MSSKVYKSAEDVLEDKDNFNNYLEIGQYILDNNLKWNNKFHYTDSKKYIRKWIRDDICDPIKLIDHAFSIILCIDEGDNTITKDELLSLLSLFEFNVEQYTEILDLCGVYDHYYDAKVNKDEDFLKIIKVNPNKNASEVLIKYILVEYYYHDLKKKLDKAIKNGLILFVSSFMKPNEKVILASLYPDKISKISVEEVVNSINSITPINQIELFRKYKNGIDFNINKNYTNNYKNIVYNLLTNDTINEFDKLYLELVDKNGIFKNDIQSKHTYKYLIEKYNLDPNIRINSYNNITYLLTYCLKSDNHYDIAKMLVKKGAQEGLDINLYNKSYMSIIKYERICRFIKKYKKELNNN